MANQKTINALLSRSVDWGLAKKLSDQGYTLSKLAGLSNEELKVLGLHQSSIDSLRGERPPIPDETRFQLMYELRSTCCVCRDNQKSIVIHHIKPWHISRNHCINNLILLCPDCHDKAHSKKELTQNLTPETLVQIKQRWIEEVKRNDIEIITNTKQTSFLSSSLWDYFNHNRIAELVGKNKKLNGFNDFFENGINKQFLYSGTIRYETPYRLFSESLKEILAEKKFIFINNNMSKNEIESLIPTCNLIVLTANHRFKKLHNWTATGPGQKRKCYYKKRGFHFKSIIDSWECTSQSSYGNLSGNWICSSVLFVRNTTFANNSLIVNATCLAIGTNIVPHDSSTPSIAYRDDDIPETTYWRKNRQN